MFDGSNTGEFVSWVFVSHTILTQTRIASQTQPCNFVDQPEQDYNRVTKLKVDFVRQMISEIYRLFNEIAGRVWASEFDVLEMKPRNQLSY